MARATAEAQNEETKMTLLRRRLYLQFCREMRKPGMVIAVHKCVIDAWNKVLGKALKCL